MSTDRTDDAGNGNGESSSIDSNIASASVGRPSDDPYDRPESPPVQDETPKHRRFSMLRFRNASDSQLSARLKAQQQVEKPPPMPRHGSLMPQKKPSRMKLATMRMRKSADLPRLEQDTPKLMRISTNKQDRRKTMTGLSEDSSQQSSENGKQMVTFEEPRRRPQTSAASQPGPMPPDHSNEHNSQQPVLTNRLSESERSEGSSGEHGVYQTTTTTTHTVSTTTFFRLPRRKPKQREPLFPMSHLPQKAKTPALQSAASTSSLAPRDSTASATPSDGTTLDPARPSTGYDRATPVASPTHGPSYLNRPSGSPATALFRPGSRNSGQSSPTRTHLANRGRSSTMSSLGRNSVDDHQFPETIRTSSSTGRKSFGDLLGLSRLRQNQDGLRHGSLTPATPGSNASKNNSLQLTREVPPVVLPDRREDDTPAKYLARLEEVLNRGVIASALSRGADPFSASVLRSYMRKFSFFEEPMDMAIRKLLMEAELPKETQQIDRCLQAFANRYHECNPGIYSAPDQAYFIAFSLLILHTDVFNKNNKHKMQKPDYLKNTRGEGIFDDVLECFYDNISYTPFIHVEDDLDINGERLVGHKMKKKSIFPNGATEPLKKSKDPIDPYTLILDGKLDVLRPPLRDQIPLEEHYSYLGTATDLDLKELQTTFFKTGVLQIVSARSRPDAFMSEKTVSNPQEANPGVVDIKITKVGTLWRKDQKKKKTRSPWQEWGAILTGAQLYFFRNTAWVKNLMHQYETHVKHGNEGIPLIFKPPLEQFKPDALMSTEGAVALFDASYKKHKNAFVYVRHGGFEEVLLAQSEEDRNDWLAKLNYAAAFRTSGVRMRGVVGGNYEGQSRRAIRRLDSSEVTQVIQTPTGEVSINRGRIDHKMAQDILTARREIMSQRISEADEKLQAAQKHLDSQLRNARHLLILAPIQEKTRDQVRGGAAKVIAQLKWSRTEIWRLKCHRDILVMDLEEEKAVNGDLEDLQSEVDTSSEKPSLLHLDSKASSHKTQQQSPRSPPPLSLSRSSGSAKHQVDGESPDSDVFQTPPTSATAPTFQRPQPRDVQPLGPDHAGLRKPSVSSVASSTAPTPSSPPRAVSSPASGQDRSPIDEHSEEDAGERQVLEQAGLLDIELSRTSDRRPTSSPMASEDTFERSKRISTAIADKERLDRNKLRRSLQRTLRDSAGHLSHHRSRKGKDSASSTGMSDETIREEVLSRGTGSFTVHGKKASVINFGSELQNMSPEERLRQRKLSQVEDQLLSPLSTDDDFQSFLGDPSPTRERRESVASAATARSFRELHRKYSSARSGGLVVPSDEDSDAALSFSDGHRTPLPPLEDGSGDEAEATLSIAPPKQAQFFTPDASSSPVEETGGKEGPEHDEITEDVDRLTSPAIQIVSA
ncbi:uncharacterized protein BCR38DRAFT_454050 [Pseudomassariella vexata]|uniref:Protein transport protein sec73 n=1 Tax=Pseudomassariella vexata TaxID=1141098 RepID=A0A1Y2EJA3_9PEZI|nr:uncharacterized protein BCR38DRAFT_454050 [Pseudomassariella vexata]ORY71547.1 hypothetical protein BCR38DRAFT_454050 [Pseudomassariella vexata]